VEYYATVFAIAESPLSNGKGTIWTGSDDGLIHLTRDGGAHWTNVTPKDLPPWSRISIIEASHFDLGTAYVAANRYQLDDNEPYLYKTTDFGKTWARIDAGIARDQFTRVIREDPARRGLLYVGTERGVWVSFDDGADWQPLQLNLPPVPVHDLSVTQGDLVAATHGRSFWILDDLSPLRQLSREIASASAHLFEPRDVYRARFVGGADNGAQHLAGPPRAGNPPSGAVVYYWLGAGGEPVTLEFLDANRRVLRTFASRPSAGSDASAADGGDHQTRVPNARGLNTFAWDLRMPDPLDFRGMVLWAGHPTGARVVPGRYSVRLTVDGHSEARSFDLLADPRSHATQAELEEQFALASRIDDTLSAANEAVRTIRNVRTQLAAAKPRLDPDHAREFRALARPLVDSLARIEETIHQVHSRSSEDPLNFPIRLNDKLAVLASYVDDGNGRPTAQSYEVFDELATQLGGELRALRNTLRALDRVNALLANAGLPAIVPSSAELPQPSSLIRE
jgi:hypothetical protein